MTGFITITWAVLKLLLITASALALILLIIGLFHPVCFNVKLRASRIGQRAELWCTYLFGILSIGVVATPHTQDVMLKVLGWKKLLQRNRRLKATEPEKPVSPVPPVQPAPPPPAPTEPPAAASSGAENISHEPAKPEPLQTQPAPADAEPVVKPQTPPPADIEPDVATISAAPEPAAKIDPVTPITPVAPGKPVEVSAEPLKPLDEVTPELKGAQPEPSAPARPEGGPPPEDSWRTRFKRFRRDLNNRYRQLKGYIRLAMQKWRLLMPILKRFWARGKRGFTIVNPALMVRYALHEPYITGMFHGTMSVFSGLASRFGVSFIPVPVFTGPTIYARGCASAVIRPWRFASALLGLLFERQLYREAWLAFKWYRANRQAA